MLRHLEANNSTAASTNPSTIQSMPEIVPGSQRTDGGEDTTDLCDIDPIDLLDRLHAYIYIYIYIYILNTHLLYS